LEEVRKLPQERQRAGDLSLLGDILRAAGLFQEAKESYTGAAKQTDDRAERAANHYKTYLAALEQRQWEEGLAVLTEAVTLDEAQYAPFPLRQYQPRRILGAGGFGTAFLCHDRYMKREVVVKSLHHAELERGMDEVFAEAHALLILSREHPSIIGVQNCGYADAAETHPYIVMDYFDGPSLQVYLEQLGPKVALPLEDFVPIARQIAAAMQAAHGQGVLHRDLKPDNILVRKDGAQWQVKVIDFGLAVRTRLMQVSTSLPSRERTLYGDSAAGTARYAPPEQMGELPGIKVGPYSDVYAFGRLCCYALFRDTEPKRRQWGSIPEELAEILEGCIEKELEHRHCNFEPVLSVMAMLDPAKELAQHRAENLRRWKDSLEPRAWVVARRGRWNQDERRSLLETLQRSNYWPMDANAVDGVLEAEVLRLRQDGETLLTKLLTDALNRTLGQPTREDSVAAGEICRNHGIS
jgi:tRNA A-37 threonylcarbamoyl transferase component Bud32